ncbi:Dynein regulatory complex [Giardia muris]|uniref:Dynein regulatory complex n=1 Tax=Giardia muris TaxID=5742 RepID=A0A4Z1SW54_GIAMU|nr:Dynein regulatory complex [Giardia muris]|eukprot:TNJ29115.1 Dynein regulatory complex [Giardia muris]
MPPTSKGKKGSKGTKAKKPKVTDELTAELTAKVEERDKQIADLGAELQRERESRNFFQLEKDKIYTLYEVAKSQLEEARASLRAKNQELEEVVENHQVTVRVYQQKVKDIMYGHQQDATQLKVTSEQALRAEEDFHRTRESELLREIDALKLRLKEASLNSQDMLRQSKDQHSRSNSLVRQQYEQQLWAMQKDFELKLRSILQESETRRKAEVMEVETNKNTQIDELVLQHEKNFQKMKTYYTGITTSNLDLIKSLKDELEDLRKRQIANEQLMFEIAQENRRLTQPLQNALAEVEALRRKLEGVEKENAALQRSHTRAEALQKELRAILWENDQMKQILKDTSFERDDLRARFEAAVQDVAQRSVFRETLLERRVAALNTELESRQAQLTEILAAANLDGAVANAVNAQLDSVLENKNRSIRELSFELARVMRLYNEAIRVFRTKIIEAGLPIGDLDGFRPFEVKEDL